jgi:hypothetical protein
MVVMNWAFVAGVLSGGLVALLLAGVMAWRAWRAARRLVESQAVLQRAAAAAARREGS